MFLWVFIRGIQEIPAYEESFYFVQHARSSAVFLFYFTLLLHEMLSHAGIAFKGVMCNIQIAPLRYLLKIYFSGCSPKKKVAAHVRMVHLFVFIEVCEACCCTQSPWLTTNMFQSCFFGLDQTGTPQHNLHSHKAQWTTSMWSASNTERDLLFWFTVISSDI